MSTPPYQPPSRYQPEPGQAGYAPYGRIEHPQGTMILIFGILGVAACGLLGPVAWIMGNNALAEIDRNPLAYTNRGVVQAGRICGIIATVLLAVSVLLMAAVILAAAASSTST